MSAVFLDAFVDPKGRPLFFFSCTVCQSIAEAGNRAGVTGGAGKVEAGGKVKVESEVCYNAGI
jgi:hypothetical protein